MTTAHQTGAGRPRPDRLLIIFDVNETLSDMAPMAERFEQVGAPAHLARTWFAGVLRDGFALTAVGVNRPFAAIAAQGLRVALEAEPLNRSLGDAVDHVLAGFADLSVHRDVPDAVRTLADAGHRLVTLSNGATTVAEGLLERAGVRGHVEAVLSVEDAPLWKPAAAAYAYALGRCAADPADAMLVAVHPWDVDGASRAGLATTWVNRSGGSYPDHFRQPDRSVGSLAGLAAELSR